MYQNHGQTLGAASGRTEFPPYGDFLVSDPTPTLREVETGGYADPMPPESVEGRGVDAPAPHRLITEATL